MIDSPLAEQLLAGSRRAIARLLTLVENEHPAAQPALAHLYAHTGNAHLIGVTGAPGTGKSSLVSQLAATYRQQNKTVAVLAVDPTSPFSGGAILGDRIRMRDLAGDPGVFIRSMASRGNLGGLSRATHNALNVLDAAGFDIILIETVGVGQGEVEIARAAHTVLVVEAPGLGDDIQAIKAGILEIADIFVVNKADRPDVRKTAAALQAMLELGHPVTRQSLYQGQFGALFTLPHEPPPPEPLWQIPIIQTSTVKFQGISQLVEAIAAHYQHLVTTGELATRNHARLTDELELRLQTALMQNLLQKIPPTRFAEITAKLVNRSLSPYNAVQLMLEDYFS